jgi:hypothetical protein
MIDRGLCSGIFQRPVGHILIEIILSPILECRLGVPAANPGECPIGDAFGALGKVSAPDRSLDGANRPPDYIEGSGSMMSPSSPRYLLRTIRRILCKKQSKGTSAAQRNHAMCQNQKSSTAWSCSASSVDEAKPTFSDQARDRAARRYSAPAFDFDRYRSCEQGCRVKLTDNRFQIANDLRTDSRSPDRRVRCLGCSLRHMFSVIKNHEGPFVLGR